MIREGRKNNETREIINFIKEIVYNYAPKVDKLYTS